MRSREFKAFLAALGKMGDKVSLSRRGNGRWYVVEVVDDDGDTRLFRIVRPDADGKALGSLLEDIRKAAGYPSDNDPI